MSIKIELSERIKRLPKYLFVEIDAKKQEMIKKGEDIIDMGIGDPDMPTPLPVIDEMKKSVEDPLNHKYPSNKGLKVFRESIAKWFKKRFSVNLDVDNEILPLLGSKEGIAHIPFAFISSKDDIVLVPDPGYPVYNSATIIAGGQPYKMPLLKKNGFVPDFSAIPEGVLKRARIMHLNYPNNPTSAIVDKSFFKEVIELAKKYNIIICHDAAYTEISYGDYRAPSFLEVDGAKEVGIEFHSFSKTYNMTGWRIAFAVGNKDIINGLAKVKSNMDSGIFQAVQYAGIAALNMDDDFIKERNKIYEERKNTLVEGLKNIGFDVFEPKATFYVWFSVPRGFTSQSFAMKVLEEAKVIITPGNGFGESGEGYVRAALTVDSSRIKEAIERIKNCL